MNKPMLYLSWLGQFLSMFTLGCCITFIWNLGWKSEFAFASLVAVIAFICSIALEKYLKIQEMEKALLEED